MNDEQREQWIMNDEGLYNDFIRSKLSMRADLRRQRGEVDGYIQPVLDGDKPAHHGAYPNQRLGA